jgi:hypothetical protein
MNGQKRLLAGTVFAACIGIAALVQWPTAAVAFQAKQQENHERGAQPAQNQHHMMPMCADMTVQRKAAGERLSTLLKGMNEAVGEAKVTAMAELLTALVNDRQAMQTMMAHCSMMKQG